MTKIIRSLACLLLCMLLPFGAWAEEVQTETVVPNVTDIFNQHTELDLSPYLGKTVLVNFFTEWCTYCMQEMPDMKKVNDLYDPETFQMVLVHVWSGEDESNTESVKEKFGMHHMTFFEDKDMKVTGVAGVPGFPATLILNPDGTLAGGQSGMLTFDVLTSVLDQMGCVRLEAE